MIWDEELNYRLNRFHEEEIERIDNGEHYCLRCVGDVLERYGLCPQPNYDFERHKKERMDWCGYTTIFNQIALANKNKVSFRVDWFVEDIYFPYTALHFVPTTEPAIQEYAKTLLWYEEGMTLHNDTLRVPKKMLKQVSKITSIPLSELCGQKDKKSMYLLERFFPKPSKWDKYIRQSMKQTNWN